MPVNWGIRPEKGFIGISDLLRIKNDQFGIMNRTALKKRKSSFEGGAGMSGANAGGGCW